MELSLYDKEELFYPCKVQVLTNTYTGETSIGWWPMEEDKATTYIKYIVKLRTNEYYEYKCSKCYSFFEEQYGSYCPMCGRKIEKVVEENVECSML